jgi:hypothetical protein
MIPAVSIRKVDGGTGTVRPSDVGVGAIIAPSELGTVNRAEMFLQTDPALAEFGGGALLEDAAYAMTVSGNPMLLVKGAGSTPGAYGTVALVGTGTSVPTGDVTQKPNDAFNVKIKITTGCTIGVMGGAYTYSLDGGQTESAVQSLGTAIFILIPNSGVKIDLAVGTLVAGDIISCTTTGPTNSNADLVNALEALRLTREPFELVLYDGPADATTVTNLDAWIKALQLTGRFKSAVCTARARKTDGTETEAAYATYLSGLFSASTSLDVVVAADVGDVVSPFPNRGTTSCIQSRPVGLALFARALQIPLGEDPAYVERGPVDQFGVSDVRGGPNHHDEFLNPGLDTLRLATLRSFPGRQGSYLTNAPLLSPSGSDFVYLQHARTINRACEIAYEILSKALSRGVGKSLKVGAQGQRYISEGAALRIEAAANAAIAAELTGQVDAIQFTVSRTDDISSNAGATVNASIGTVSLAYIKKFAVTAGFVKSL